LKTIHVGGITVLKVKGRGKTLHPEIHASLGTEMFRPEFGDKYALQAIVSDNKETMLLKLLEQILKYERSLSHQSDGIRGYIHRNLSFVCVSGMTTKSILLLLLLLSSS